VKNLLEQTPSSTDDAEEWLEKLQDSMETVELQYAELTREEEATRLEIQYTYDTTILAGSLAEITYEQDTAELEETLQEAKDALEELKEAKALLETYENGVITSDQAGTIAAVNYEADDVLNASVALCSFYDTGTVTISIEVPQEEVASLAVGASVDVTVTGYGDREGTILEKGTEAVSGESRTNVNYLGTIQLDNSDGRLTSNLAAKITVSDEEETENE
jgi:multidrug resistance efflux pump